MSVPMMQLNDGVAIPQLGFGVWQIPQDQTARAVSDALAAGYRHIDTAAIYRNEREVGQAIAASGLGREELFVTTKLWNEHHGKAAALAACDESLSKLGLDYVDLYLIHWPCPSTGQQVEAWEALVELKAAGKARSIGLSNYRAQDIRACIAATGVTPSVNQIELHPSFQQPQMRAVHAELGIVTEAWSPLGVGEDLTMPEITKVAAAHGVTPAQAVLRWHIQLGNVVFPKTLSAQRMAENFDIFGFELTGEEMDLIAAADTGTRQGWDPGTM